MKRPPSFESQKVLDQLRDWVLFLYEIRNSYSHGKGVSKYLFLGNRRSCWQDAFEVFLLAANRMILQRPELRPLEEGTRLGKLMMSYSYLEKFIQMFGKQNGREIFQAQQTDTQKQSDVEEVLRNAVIIDPEMVEYVESLPQFEQSLYGLSSLIYYLVKEKVTLDHETVEGFGSFLTGLEEAYKNAQKPPGGAFNVKSYLKEVAPGFKTCDSGIPILADRFLLLGLTQLFTKLYSLYEDFKIS